VILPRVGALELVDADRLRDLTLELVEIESHTGDTADVAHRYAAVLREIGLEVEVLEERFPATPVVVGRLRGSEPGPTIVLNGHLDTVPIPHDAPRVEGGRVWGRGSADMKGPVAAATEAVRVVAESGREFPGELVLVAIGLHEAPGGRGEDLTWLLGEHGFTADYAIVCELSGDRLIAAHMGQATVEIDIVREGMPTHELQTPAGTPNPVLVAARVIEAVRARNEELAGTEHPWVGAETYFFGEVHGGDFYNRHPATCRLVGTRRWAPGNTLATVQAEYDGLLAPIAAESGCRIEARLKLVRDAYSIDPEHPLARALRGGYEEVTGETLETAGVKVVADAAVFQAVGGIPTVYHGPRGEGAHADVESVAVDELVRSARIYLATLERLWAGV
jgi:acetylornithine deacetylase/succinyl-diaminopimelate desuccinylase-like protein